MWPWTKHRYQINAKWLAYESTRWQCVLSKRFGWLKIIYACFIDETRKKIWWISIDFEMFWFAFQTQFKLNAGTTRALRGLVVQMRELGFKLWRFTFPIIIKKRATLGLSAKRHLNGVSLTDRKCPVTVFWLGLSTGLVVQIREVGLNYRTSHSQWS